MGKVMARCGRGFWEWEWEEEERDELQTGSVLASTEHGGRGSVTSRHYMTVAD